MKKQIIYKKKGRNFIEVDGRNYECYAELHDSDTNEYMYYIYILYLLNQKTKSYTDNFKTSLESCSGYKVYILDKEEFDKIPCPQDIAGEEIVKFGMLELVK